MVMADTVGRPGGDAAVVRVHGTSKGIAATCDVTPRYVLADPSWAPSRPWPRPGAT